MKDQMKDQFDLMKDLSSIQLSKYMFHLYFTFIWGNTAGHIEINRNNSEKNIIRKQPKTWHTLDIKFVIDVDIFLLMKITEWLFQGNTTVQGKQLG